MRLTEVRSIFQIRYGGAVLQKKGSKAFLCKGISLVDPFNDDTHTISVRDSMTKIKMKGNDDWGEIMNLKLGIVGYSSKKIGELNKQLICLLSLSVPEQVLFEIQTLILFMLRILGRIPFRWVIF